MQALLVAITVYFLSNEGHSFEESFGELKGALKAYGGRWSGFVI